MLESVVEFIEMVLEDRPFAIAGLSYRGYLVRGIANAMPDRVLGMLLICPVIDGIEANRNKAEWIDQIADILYCDRPAATVIINNLLKQNMVEKTQDPENKKRVRIMITDLGSETQKRIDSQEKTTRIDPVSCLTADEKKAFERLLKKVQSFVNRLDQEGA